MIDRLNQVLERSAHENEYNELQTHIEMIEAGGWKKWISLANLKFKYMFRSKGEILERLQEDKAELEELDYIG